MLPLRSDHSKVILEFSLCTALQNLFQSANISEMDNEITHLHTGGNIGHNGERGISIEQEGKLGEGSWDH